MISTAAQLEKRLAEIEHKAVFDPAKLTDSELRAWIFAHQQPVYDISDWEPDDLQVLERVLVVFENPNERTWLLRQVKAILDGNT